MSNTKLDDAYHYCLEMVRNHYENFPVASRILPRALRRPISVVYAFARSADDFADEGNLTDDERLTRLVSYETELENIKHHIPSDKPIFIALADVIAQHNLPIQLFYDLLTAFKQDVTKKRYQNFDEVLYYCRHSANPVGRLLLHLTGNDSEQNLKDSDAICSALQLINFLQDIQQDYHESGRIYIPLDDMASAGVSEDNIRDRSNNESVHKLLRQQIKRAYIMLCSGATLGNRLSGRFGYEIRMVTLGGARISRALLKQKHDVYQRPRLGKSDWLGMLFVALFPNKRIDCP
ncbi:MAG: squalene synthase HpnC [Gammaproteobacteria bacterium]|nr:MAG: squalene synthase HpnC [Gammaproteobacteria bacterium]